jgi:XrtJ-associated TM-motif-TM protein
MKKYSPYLVAATLILCCAPVYAQSGCADSPENPTAVLALVGSAGALLVSLRGRFSKK